MAEPMPNIPFTHMGMKPLYLATQKFLEPNYSLFVERQPMAGSAWRDSQRGQLALRARTARWAHGAHLGEIACDDGCLKICHNVMRPCEKMQARRRELGLEPLIITLVRTFVGLEYGGSSARSC